MSLLDPFEIGEKGGKLIDTFNSVLRTLCCFDAVTTLAKSYNGGTKTVTLRDANEDAVGKVCIVVQKTSDNAGGKPKRGFSLHSTQNI